MDSSIDTFGAKGRLQVGEADYEIYRLSTVEGSENLPYSLKVLLENLLRTEDGANITADHIRAIGSWDDDAEPDTEIQFTPARVIMQDFTGVPCIVDLATMREAMVDLGGDPTKINPLAPAELVIDHSVITDVFGRADAFERNVELEYERNRERYQFLRWGQTAFDDFKVVPPGTGIVHQVNIEYLARTVTVRDGVSLPRHLRRHRLAHDDGQRPRRARLGRRRHRGRGGDARPARVDAHPAGGRLPADRLDPAGATATDVVLTITETLRKHGVVGKFVEFYGDGVAQVPLANRATIGNMSPEFGSTGAIFPIDDVTLDYLRLTGRSAEQVALVEAYAKEQGLWHDPSVEPRFSERTRAGPVDRRPLDRRPETSAGPHRAHRRQGGSSARSCRPTSSTTRATPVRRRASPPATPRRREPPTAPTVAAGRRTTATATRDPRRRCRSPRPRARASRSTTASSRSPRSPRAPTPRTRRS